MRFAWTRATADDTSPDRAPTETAPDELAAVELLTDEGRRVVWIATRGKRTSDWLNAHAEVPVHGLTDAAAADDVAAPSAPPNGEPILLERSKIVWAVPPPLPANRHLRLHRRRVLVHLELDEWEVSGQAHVRPGADATDQVLRGTRELVPLTEVQVVSRADPKNGFAAPVLIVNRRHVRRVGEDTPHVSAAVPDPAGPADPTDPSAAAAAEPAPPPAPAPTVPVGEADQAPSGPVSDPTRAAAEAPAETPIESGADLVQAALAVLLEVGVIDVVEFQSIRARIPAPPPD